MTVFSAVAGGLMLCVTLGIGCAAPNPAWPPALAHSKIATTMGGYHSTTRGTIRLVFPHRGRWLVFRGGPSTYHFSDDGKTHLIRGDTIHTFYTVLVKPAPDWVFDKFVATGTISGKTIRWGQGRKIDTRLSYYNDIRQDSDGRFTMTGRAVTFNEKREAVRTEVLWKRTRRPGDFLDWCPDVPAIRHHGDPAVGNWWKKIGSTVHENLTLDGGRSYVFGMMTVDGAGKLYGNLFDGRSWSAEDAELASGMSTWAGTDRRMCAVYDRSSRRIHLAWVNALGRLLYRTAGPPYGPRDWSAPVELHRKTFCAVLSLDTSHAPAHVYLLFGRTRYQGRDRRNTYGELHLQRFDGKRWSEPVLVSEPGTKDNWYPNMNEDVRHGIGVVYLRGSRRTRKGDPPPLDILFATTGPPRPTPSRP
ncbi:MAG: hypothetical protein ACYS5V_12895 [Planctomycetota bacterium]|jgi:hypothetical protein